MTNAVLPDVSKGVLVMTFDDAFTAQWLAAAPIFSQHAARVTFFVTRPDQLNARQIEDLRQLRGMGHALGCHGLRHENAVEGISKQGVEGYLKREIDPAMEVLSKMGFAPSAFAYPSSARNEETDRGLLTKFRHLRAGGVRAVPGKEMKDRDELFVPSASLAGTGCLTGVGIDYLEESDKGGTRHSIGSVLGALERARARGEVIVFYAHNISENGPGHFIRPEILGRVLAHAQTIGLPAVTYDALP